MSIICPHCSHSMNVKGLRAGRFTPKCSKCAQTFLLMVKLDPEPSFETSKLPTPTKPVPAPAFDPNATAPSLAAEPIATPARARPAAMSDATAPLLDEPSSSPGGRSGAADFSVAASIARSMPESPDQTQALEQSAAPARRKAVRLEATEAGDEDEVPRKEEQEDTLTGTIGGYRVERELGRGGMGAVYLARQVSLDRFVALKVMNSQWSSNPNFLVRFTREAYAAAQLVHHNVVQVYDIGEDRGINFFSMEFVEGRSLGDLLKKDGKLSAESAAGYILQAARGLKFAHDRGMIHRDIKPDNLMVNTQGVVKVADLGLVRTPGSEEPPRNESGEIDTDAIANRAVLAVQKVTKDRTLNSLSGVTLVGQAMGTPSYMAPEQARDATSVDHRADIYSLGCTLYVLLTARPVFAGTTALEVMTMHASDTPIRPEVHNRDVPRALSDITLRMLAKKPDDRYASMDDVIKVLEDFLGLHAAGKQATSEAHIRTLEQGVKAFQQVPAVKIRSWILLGFFTICGTLFPVLSLMGLWKTGGFFLGLVVLTASAYGIVHGSARRSHLFLRLRDMALSLGWLDYAKVGLGLLLFVGVLYFVGLFWVWLGAGVLAIGLAVGLHYTLDQKMATQRATALEKVERMLKTLRMRGLSEDALQEFVAKYTGDHWEEVFEALYGYETKLTARSAYGSGPKGARPKFGAWRDSIVRWLDRYQRARQEARERQHLQKIEQKGLEAQGVNASEAKQQAERVAGAMVQAAAEIKKEAAVLPDKLEATVLPHEGIDVSTPKPRSAPPPKRVNLHDLMAVAVDPHREPLKAKPILPVLLGIPFGSTTRFFVGAVLLGLSFLWMKGAGLLPTSTSTSDELVFLRLWKTTQERIDPLKLPLPDIANNVFSSINAAIAGLVLLVSIIWRSWKIGFFVMAGAAVTVVGAETDLIPALGPMTAQVSCLAIGGGMMALGFLVGRDT